MIGCTDDGNIYSIQYRRPHLLNLCLPFYSYRNFRLILGNLQIPGNTLLRYQVFRFINFMCFFVAFEKYKIMLRSRLLKALKMLYDTQKLTVAPSRVVFSWIVQIFWLKCLRFYAQLSKTRNYLPTLISPLKYLPDFGSFTGCRCS